MSAITHSQMAESSRHVGTSGSVRLEGAAQQPAGEAGVTRVQEQLDALEVFSHDRVVAGAVAYPNPHPYPGNGGADAWVAHLQAYPGTMAFGATEGEARNSLATGIANEVAVAKADADARERLTSSALVQFNHRITAEQKAEIKRRAMTAGMSTRQFLLVQCLKAPMPVVGGGGELSKVEIDELWKGAATAMNAGGDGAAGSSDAPAGVPAAAQDMAVVS